MKHGGEFEGYFLLLFKSYCSQDSGLHQKLMNNFYSTHLVVALNGNRWKKLDGCSTSTESIHILLSEFEQPPKVNYLN